MIDVLSDSLIGMDRVSEMLGVHKQTVYTWWRFGIRGVKLETAMKGSTRVTTAEALNDFCRRRASLDSAAPAKPNKRSPEMESRLRKAGLL